MCNVGAGRWMHQQWICSWQQRWTRAEAATMLHPHNSRLIDLPLFLGTSNQMIRLAPNSIDLGLTTCWRGLPHKLWECCRRQPHCAQRPTTIPTLSHFLQQRGAFDECPTSLLACIDHLQLICTELHSVNNNLPYPIPHSRCFNFGLAHNLLGENNTSHPHLPCRSIFPPISLWEPKAAPSSDLQHTLGLWMLGYPKHLGPPP